MQVTYTKLYKLSKLVNKDQTEFHTLHILLLLPAVNT